MYRINTYDDLYSTGFFDYLDTGILVIEWSENIENALPDGYVKISFEKGEGDNDRIITVDGGNGFWIYYSSCNNYFYHIISPFPLSA